jgi:predicted acylesterase/phospholipase RssA
MSKRQKRWRRLLPAFAFSASASAGLGGCAAVHRPATTPAAILESRAALRTIDRTLRDTVIARLVRRAAARHDGMLDVLMLSGGGQNGAFGTGFLRGWSERTESPMPRFDLVTGISTGALQAPYALLGTPAALDTITQLYARAATSIAPTIDWLFWLRRTGGLVKTTRYDRALRESFDGAFRNQLRVAFAEDRQLIIGTTDFDLGVGRLWSLGDVLQQGDDGLVRTSQLLKAATAIPAIFPPVMLDGHLHADGGVVENVAPTLTFEDYQQLGRALTAKGLGAVTVRLWVVMNLWTHPEARVISPSSRKQIDSRSTSLLFYLHQSSTLQGLGNLARAVSAEVPGVRMQLQLSTVPAALSTAPGAQKLFDARFMALLDSLGYAKARSAAPWDVVTTAFVRPER